MDVGTSTLTFEFAQACDAAVIARIWIAANRVRRGATFDADFSAIENLVKGRIEEGEALVVIAREAGRAIAIGCQLPARENDGTGPKIPGLMHLSMIAVDPSHWGRGFGNVVTRFCIDQAAQLGYTSVQLWTHVSNQRAQRLYSSVGFKEAGRQKLDERGERIRLYALRLGDRPSVESPGADK